jgi:probable rRNA maturation factor
MYDIAIANEQALHAVDEDRLRAAVRKVLDDHGIRSASVSIAIVDDATIERLNQQYLKHTGPTDVLSFVLEASEGRLEGEIIASAETAAASAARFGWDVADELLLYVIHGALHLVGYDDANDESLAAMRKSERLYLSHFGLTPQYEALVPGARS